MGKVSVRGMRLLLALAAALAVGLIAAGCGGGGGEEGGGGGNGLEAAIETEPDILNPFISGGDASVTTQVTSGILEAPYEITPDLEYSPQLAEGEAEVVSEDPLTIEYQLRDDITFSDGEPVTSADAEFTYEQIMDEDNEVVTRTGWEDIEEFQTPDDRTVRWVFDEPYAGWRDMTAEEILPEHVYEGENFNEAANNEIIGSGPFVLDEWNKGENLSLERNDEYWGEEAGLETVNFSFISDTNTQLNSLENGEIDFVAPSVSIGTYDNLDGLESSGIEYQDEPGVSWNHIAFNTEEVSKEMRQAIAYGIDRSQITDELLEGQVDVLDSTLVPDQEPYYKPSWEEYRNDPEQARELVEEAEANGEDTEITFRSSSGSQLIEAVQQIVQQQLDEVGIDVEIETVDSQTFLTQDLPEGNYEMGSFGWVATPDPSQRTLFSGEQIPPEGQNFYFYDNEAVTELLSEADTTIEEDERAEITREIQDLMAEDVPVIPTYQSPEISAYNESVEGVDVNPTLAGPYWNIGEWEME